MEAIYAGIPLTGPTQTEHTGPVDLPLDLLLQIDQLMRSEEPFIEARGNRMSPVGFSCTRRYENLLLAMDARAMFLRSLPESGVLELSQTTATGTLTIVAAARLDRCPSPTLSGRAVRFTFNFAAKEFHSEILAAPIYLRAENNQILLAEDGSPLLAEQS